MNESAGDQITEVLNPSLQLTATHDLDGTDDADEKLPSPPPREGLPRSFRMRHDAHYVDELMSRTTPGNTPATDRAARSRPHPEPAPTPPPVVAPAPAPARVERPANVPSGGPYASAAAVSLIASRLESVVAHADAIRTHHTTSLLIANSVNTEFARVARLARAAAILEHHEAPVRRSLSARAIGERIIMTSAPAARLAGLECEVTVDDPAFVILAESTLVVQGIAGTIDALMDLLFADPSRTSIGDPGDPAARISIRMQSVRVRPALIVDLICPALLVGSSHSERFFDNTVDDYRLAPAAGILLAAAAHVVRAHGGRADVKRHAGIGVTITYVFPQAASEYAAS